MELNRITCNLLPDTLDLIIKQAENKLSNVQHATKKYTSVCTHLYSTVKSGKIIYFSPF